MKTLRRGDRIPEVEELQKLLRVHGYKIVVDGDFGPKTASAVMKFQSKRGLVVDGIVGRKTWSALGDDPQKDKLYRDDDEDNTESKYTWCLENGHGGMIDGVYQTRGKRSPEVPPGIYEGEFNRAIVERLCALCEKEGISYYNVVPEQRNIPLRERVRRVNDLHKRKKNCVFLSIHANAFGNSGWSSPRGVAVFYDPNHRSRSKKSEKIARRLQELLVEETNMMDRGVKTATFHVIRETRMPAILSENGFMTNRDEAKKLASEEFRDKIAMAHFRLIKEFEDGKIKF